MATILAIIALVPAPHIDAGAVAMPRRPVCDRVCHVRRHWQRTVRPYRARLRRMAWCESTGRWHISTGNGYYGGLQFSLSSWRAVGGSGYPHHATRLEQMYRAVRLSRLQGWGAWPNCA